MRRISAAAAIALLVAAQGCTINLPPNFFNGLGIAATPRPTLSPPTTPCDRKFLALDEDGDGFLTELELFPERRGAIAPVTVKTVITKDAPRVFSELDIDRDGRVSRSEFLDPCHGGGKPSPMPSSGTVIVAKGTFYGFDSCAHALQKFDRDFDGRLSPGEYAVWSMGIDASVRPMVCQVPEQTIVGNNGAGYEVLTTPALPPSAAPGLPPSPPPACAEPSALPPFEKWDLNRDQFIDKAELCADGIPVIVPPPAQPPCGDTFKRADRNADGLLSPDEYFQGDFAPPLPDGVAKPAVMPSEGELAERFKRLDVNADGRLDLKEFCSNWGPVVIGSPTPPPPTSDCNAMVKGYDANRDGKVTWEEYYMGFIAPISARYDGQKDEIHKRFTGLDRNGDGALAPDEFCPVVGSPAPMPTPKPTPTPTPVTTDVKQ